MKFLALLSALTFSVATSLAHADTWPSKPIRLVVAAPGGSSLDIIARTIGDKLKSRLGQAIVVDNIPGASGTIATANVARAAPDGHTLLMSYNGPLSSAQFLARLPYDPQKDLAPVILTSSQPNVLAVNPDVPAKNVPELIAYAKANPGKLNYASVGNGSSSHLTMELFKTMAGIDVLHVPYNGAPPAAMATVAGESHMLFGVPSVILPQVRNGKLKAIAVTSANRFPLLPQLPTMSEAGLPKFEALAWNGILAPARTPAGIVSRLNREIDSILKMPDVKARLNNVGLEPAGGSPESFKLLMSSEAQKWSEVIKKTGAKLD
ncbi:Bug family tripartite tricarboxylate transporter substrate binding protein [Noviherbaspirillum massiliense]|uniref:Bug family tripartite tricarboxylate transporter substrate binding protein n=1 Tax=Noviherbaspirillum massiliense TaxID=1465823 RepID=UPI0002DF4706|nr:tripartite tricarboxylate transporter substrate-binding protein [Noviherbaspirillum massiliense]